MIINEGKRDDTKNKPIRAGALKKILADVPANAIIVFQDVEEKKKNEQEIVKDYIFQKQTFSNGEEIKKLILTNNSRKLR